MYVIIFSSEYAALVSTYRAALANPSGTTW
jgi:hypothetical protein